jgi:hypothetical protein
MCRLTERTRAVGHEDDDRSAYEKLFKRWIEADHVVGDCGEDGGIQDEQRHLGQHLAQKVHVHAVHPVEVFSQEYGQLLAEYLNHRNTRIYFIGYIK